MSGPTETLLEDPIVISCGAWSRQEFLLHPNEAVDMASKSPWLLILQRFASGHCSHVHSGCWTGSGHQAESRALVSLRSQRLSSWPPRTWAGGRGKAISPMAKVGEGVPSQMGKCDTATSIMNYSHTRMN